MPTTEALPRTAIRSAQLIAASERSTLDPFTVIDWDVPIDDSDEIARANPHHQARVIDGFAKLAALLTELGVIDDATRPMWQDLALVDEER